MAPREKGHPGSEREQRTPPFLVVEIPAQGLAQAFVKSVLRGVSEFGAGLGFVDGIAAIMPGAVGNEGLEAGGWLPLRGWRIGIARGKAVDLSKGAVDFGANSVDHWRYRRFEIPCFSLFCAKVGSLGSRKTPLGSLNQCIRAKFPLPSYQGIGCA